MDKSRSPNRSQTSVSPKPGTRDQIPLKKSFTRGGEQEKKEEHSFVSSISQSKLEQKGKKEERDCLNVFEEDEL